MELKSEKISEVIRSQIKYYENAIIQNETGTVLTVGDGISRVSGLANCMSGELLEFQDGSFGMAQNLEDNSVSAVLFGSLRFKFAATAGFVSLNPRLLSVCGLKFEQRRSFILNLP